MPATVLIREKNGAGETATDKTSGTVRFKMADDATVDSNDRLQVPASGQNYSFRKVLQANISVAPDVDIQNLVAYTDGANGFGTGIKVWYAATATYTEPTAPSTAEDPPQFPGATPMVDLFGATEGSPISLGAGPFSSTGDIGDYLNLVMEVESTASQGALTAEQLTVSFDET